MHAFAHNTQFVCRPVHKGLSFCNYEKVTLKQVTRTPCVDYTLSCNIPPCGCHKYDFSFFQPKKDAFTLMCLFSPLFSLVWLPGNEQMVLVRKEYLCKQRYITFRNTKSLDCFNQLPQHYPKTKVLGLQINNYCFHMFYDVTIQQPCLELDWRRREYISPFISKIIKGQEMTRFILQLLTFYNLSGC